MANGFSDIDPRFIANAGTSRQIGNIGQGFRLGDVDMTRVAQADTASGGFLGSLNEGLESGFRVLSPDFRRAREGEESSRVRQERLELERQRVEAEKQKLIRQSETVVVQDVFPNAPPSLVKFITERLRLQGVEVSEAGRTNKQQLIKTLQSTPPEVFQEGFKMGIDELDRGISGLEVQITKEAAKTGHSLFDPQGGAPLSDKEAAKRVLNDPQLISSNKKLAQLIGTRDQNLTSLNGLNQMSTGLRDEQKAPTVPKPTGLTKTFNNFGIDINDPNQIAAITDDEWEALAAQIDSTGELSGETLKQLVFRNFAGGAPIVTSGSENAQTGSTDPLGLRQ